MTHTAESLARVRPSLVLSNPASTSAIITPIITTMPTINAAAAEPMLCVSNEPELYGIPLAFHEMTTSTLSSEDMIWWMMVEIAADGSGLW
jgi:hypothetical protein